MWSWMSGQCLEFDKSSNSFLALACLTSRPNERMFHLIFQTSSRFYSSLNMHIYKQSAFHGLENICLKNVEFKKNGTYHSIVDIQITAGPKFWMPKVLIKADSGTTEIRKSNGLSLRPNGPGPSFDACKLCIFLILMWKFIFTSQLCTKWRKMINVWSFFFSVLLIKNIAQTN